jgi:heme/copper-type cytochrome/quinol oxidase subunit 1
MPRRIADYSAARGWTGLNELATLGSYVIGIAMILFFVNVFVSLRKPREATDDAWGSGNSLEWATSSPPPPHNFDVLPEVHSLRPVYDMRIAARRPDDDGTQR